MNDNNLLTKADWSYDWPNVDICGPLEHPGHAFMERREFAFRKATKQCGTPSKRRFNREKTLKMSMWAQPFDLIDVSPESATKLLSGTETIPNRRNCWEQSRQLLPKREMVTILSYPFQKVAVIRVRPYMKSYLAHGHTHQLDRMDIGWLLWSVAHAYKYIYERADEYGIWGHHLGDLLFRELMIDGNNFYLGIDS